MVVLTVQSDQESHDWDQYVLGCQTASGYHLSAWRGVIHEVFGHPTTYLMARDERGVVRGVLPLVLLSSVTFGRFFISLPFFNYGGLIADNGEAMTALKEAAERQAQSVKASHIELRHQEPCGIDWPSSQRKVSMRAQLPSQFDELWNGFSSKLRSQVRRAQKEGMTVRVGGTECVEEFYEVFSRCMRDLGTPVYGKKFFDVMVKAFPKESRICVVSLGRVPLAAGFLYGFRDTLEIPWASSDKRYNRLSPNMLLYSSALQYACQQGFRLFDFGRSTPDSGTYRFKEQWGAKPCQLYWYYWLAGGQSIPKLNPDNPKFKAAISLWQRLPLPVANLIGPHIVKYLP
ncbi:MAG: FemAB family XrtA/PEP-CTERM system-associated protein [Nitrospirota bacterium]